MRRRTARRGSPAALAVVVFCAAGPGTFLWIPSAPRTAARTPPQPGSWLSASGSAERFLPLKSLPLAVLFFRKFWWKSRFCASEIHTSETESDSTLTALLIFRGGPVRSGRSSVKRARLLRRMSLFLAHLGRAGRPPSSPLSRVKLPRLPENGAAVHDPKRRFATVN
jgi:hypothetical protein